MIFKPLLIASLLIATYTLPTGAIAKKHPKKRSLAAQRVPPPAVIGSSYALHEDAMRLADDIATRRDLSRDWVRQAIGQARYLPQVAKFIQPPPVGTPKNWRLYRSRFIDPIRISAGVKFWQAHRETLARAQAQTGVPAEIIVAIIGIETLYGKQMGRFGSFAALATPQI